MKAAVAIALFALLVPRPVAADGSSCIACHADPAAVGNDPARIVSSFHSDVHAAVGLSCNDCHGGNPQRSGMEEAHASGASATFVGAPTRGEIPAFCGRCHSDPAYMGRFRPDARVDQEREYWTSRHGELLAKGDANVATCIDCHGVHDILRPSDPGSPVYPTRVAETCRRCHADAERMAGYALPDGSPLPVDQYARWSRSVHATALLQKEDLSAPTCNDCHGNHGATPPGLQSIAFVCGQCHGREAALFRDSPKRGGFQDHNEFLKAVEGEAAPCASCHEGQPAADVRGVHHFGECTTCHGNHAIVRPTMAMLGPLPPTPCAFCHEAPAGAEGFFEGEAPKRRYENMRQALLDTAQENGLEGDDRFDWLVEQARELPPHTLRGKGGTAVPKPEFLRLFEKFRIGMTHFVYNDPATGNPVREPIIRCTSCHGGAGAADAQPASAVFLDSMWGLTTNIARTERTLLRARQGGVSTTQADASLDHAVDAQIQLEALVHTFSTEKGGRFAQTAAAGLEETRTASEIGVAALEELAFRRRGLAASLVVILSVLVALWLKIRDLSRRRAAEEHRDV